MQWVWDDLWDGARPASGKSPSHADLSPAGFLGWVAAEDDGRDKAMTVKSALTRATHERQASGRPHR
jgi:hypothetical protein